MNHYAYRVFKMHITDPKFGGTVSAESMDDAVRAVMLRHKVLAYTCSYGDFGDYHESRIDDTVVSIPIYASPEHYVSGR